RNEYWRASEEIMRRLSRKRSASIPTEQAFRAELFSEIGHTCEWCRDEPATEQHEIARGPNRSRARTCRFAVLGLCFGCHRILDRMPGDDAIIVGLAILKRNRPEDYSLAGYWTLTNRRFP